MKTRLIKETWPRMGVSVITIVTGPDYETLVSGGELEGWALPSDSKEAALVTHKRMHKFIETGNNTAGLASGTLKLRKPKPVGV